MTTERCGTEENPAAMRRGGHDRRRRSRSGSSSDCRGVAKHEGMIDESRCVGITPRLPLRRGRRGAAPAQRHRFTLIPYHLRIGGFMEPGELKRRRKAKALRLLDQESGTPHFTTTEALCLIDADCGPKKFHWLLESRGYTKPVEGLKGGYDFALPLAYGKGTLSINHRSFQWTPEGVAFVAAVLNEERIDFRLPPKLVSRVNTNGKTQLVD